VLAQNERKVWFDELKKREELRNLQTFHSLPSIPFGLAGHVKEPGTG
jgi:hypothetical protein